MNKAQQEVLAFHRQFGCFVQETPNPNIHPDEQELRLKLLREEVDELDEAMDRRDIVAIADGLADVLYIAYGISCVYGIDMEPIFEEVHRTNMLKTGGGVRKDGKVMKPFGWTKPDILRLLKEQGWEK